MVVGSLSNTADSGDSIINVGKDMDALWAEIRCLLDAVDDQGLLLHAGDVVERYLNWSCISKFFSSLAGVLSGWLMGCSSARTPTPRR